MLWERGAEVRILPLPHKIRKPLLQRLYYFVNYLMKRYILLLFFVIINAQVWESSFTAGIYDYSNNFIGGSEVLHLVSHKDKLFASISYWQDESNIWYGGNNSNIGWSQIISLDNPNSMWSVDLNLDSYYLRPEILKEIIFTKDLNGNSLDAPDTLLIVGAYSSNYIIGPVIASAFVRDDDGGWNQTIIHQGDLPAGENYSIRDMELYTDQISGTEHLLVSVGTKGIFSGSYNPNIAGKIEWNLEPEVGPLDIRPLGIAIANNSLYFSSGNKLYIRNDGENPSYSIVHDFSDLSLNINSAVGGVRGLTVINNEDENNDSMLLMWCPDGQSKGTIFRLDPNLIGGFNRFYETKLSLLVEDYLPGTSVNYLLGAYNEFLKVFNHIENEYFHIVGFESTIQGGNYPEWNGYYSGALFAIRNSNAEYVLAEVNEFISFDDSPLVATRCYVQSPFANENAIYFGGFDPNGFLSTNKAWIYKRINTLSGDINNDGIVNILDVVQVVNLVLSDEYEEQGDLNGDSIVNILDIVQLVNIILN